MKTLKLALLIFLSMSLFLAGCSDQPSAIAEKENPVPENTIAASPNAATVDRQTFRVPFPPNPNVDFVPVPAPCLGLGEPLQMSGTWTGWTHTVMIPNGRVHITEKIDYTDISIKLGDLVWHAAPGASETIIQNVPLTGEDVGEAAFNVIHEFHARFISQSDKPDLRVSHRVRQLLTPDGEFKKNEFVPFTAECIGIGMGMAG